LTGDNKCDLNSPSEFLDEAGDGDRSAGEKLKLAAGEGRRFGDINFKVAIGLKIDISTLFHDLATDELYGCDRIQSGARLNGADDGPGVFPP
jgi:hypothetical protein